MNATQVLKRTMDIFAASSLLIILSPLLVFIAIAIWVREGRPIFYISKRYIEVDREESIVKFRTMVLDAKSPKYNLAGRFMKDGYLDIPVNCEVYTGTGRLLEKSQLVEALQLLNVLFHGLSIIGNRPLPKENIMHLQQFEGWEMRFASPAGMTGISQVIGKFNLKPKERLEIEKLYSRVYQEGNVLKCDFEIIFFTIRLIVTGKTISVEYARKLLESCL